MVLIWIVASEGPCAKGLVPRQHCWQVVWACWRWSLVGNTEVNGCVPSKGSWDALLWLVT